MKVVAAILGVALVVVVGIFLFRLWRQPKNGPHQPKPEASGSTGLSPSPGITELPVPKTAEEKEAEVYARERAGYLSALNASLSRHGAVCQTGERLDTLEALVEHGKEPDIEGLRDEILATGSGRYGYARIVILRRPPPGSGDPPELLAEVTRTEEGRWITFLR